MKARLLDQDGCWMTVRYELSPYDREKVTIISIDHVWIDECDDIDESDIAAELREVSQTVMDERTERDMAIAYDARDPAVWEMVEHYSILDRWEHEKAARLWAGLTGPARRHAMAFARGEQ